MRDNGQHEREGEALKRIAWSLSVALLLSACAAATSKDRMDIIYNQYDGHCREYARVVVGEVDEESRFRECMTYFYITDVDCPVFEDNSYLTRTKIYKPSLPLPLQFTDPT